MLVLGIGDKLQGDASVAGVVDYQLHGIAADELAAIGDGQFTDVADSDLLTAASVTTITTAVITNTHSAAVTINLYVLKALGTKRQVLPKAITLDAGHTIYTNFVSMNIITNEGHPIAASQVETDPVFLASEAANLEAGDKALIDTVTSKLGTAHTDNHPAPTARDARNQIVMGADDNYVTNAEKTVIGNTSGVNTGDQDLSGKLDKSGGTVINLKEQGSAVTITAGAATIPVDTCDNSLRLTLVENTALTLSGVSPTDKSIRLFITHTAGPWTLSWGGTDLVLEGTSGTSETVVLTYTGVAWWAYRAGIVDVTI